MIPSPEIIKLISCSTQLSMKFILLINVKMPTNVDILTFISMININESLKAQNEQRDGPNPLSLYSVIVSGAINL